MGVVIDIYFMLLYGKVPTIVCLKELYRKGLEISGMQRKIMREKREEDVELGKYFLINSWKQMDMPFPF